jgi:hypothetical protein
MRGYNVLVMLRLFRIIGSLGWEEGVDVARYGRVLMLVELGSRVGKGMKVGIRGRRGVWEGWGGNYGSGC